MAASISDTVARVLEDYARRGVFKSFSRGETRGGKTTFRMRWHYDRIYECVLDEKRGTLRFPALLPEVEQDSPLHKGLKKYVKSRQAETLPDHRRVDPDRVQVRTLNRGGTISLSLRSLDGDHEYATRKLINLIHEIFLEFLRDGPYIDYLVETMGLNLDQY